MQLAHWIDTRVGVATPATLAVIAGAAHTLAYAPFNLFWAGLLSMLALFWLWRRTPPSWCIWLGLAYGLAFSVTTTYWLPIGLHQHLSAAPWIGLATTVAIWLLDSLPWALAGWIRSRSTALPRAWTECALVPASLVVGWWVATWAFGGCPWMEPAYGQIDSPFAGFFPFGGHLLVSLLAALVSGALLQLSRPRRRLHAALAVVGVMLILVGGHGLRQFAWTKPAAAPIRVGVVQSNLAADAATNNFTIGANVALHLRMSRTLKERHQSDVILWSEGALAARRDEFESFMRRNLAPLETSTAFVVGLVEVHPGSLSDSTVTRRNTAEVWGKDSHGSYQKRHLLPVAEYLPTSGSLGALRRSMGAARPWGVPGPEVQADLSVKGMPVTASICYDDVFASTFADRGAVGAWLFNLTSDAWFAGSTMPWQHLALSRARAMEMQRYFVRVANIGPSAVIDEHGTVLAQTRSGEMAMLHAEIRPLHGQTPYARWGDSIVLLLTALLLAVSALVWGLSRFSLIQRVAP